MKKIKDIILSARSNWKVILFAIVYVISFLFMISLSFGITEYVKGFDYAIYSPLLLCIALLSIISIIAKLILTIVFKDEADQVAKNSSIVFIPIGILSAITFVLIFLFNIPIPINNNNELGIFISLFAVPAYIILLIMIGMFFLSISFIAFGLLRFVIKHTKAVFILFVTSSVIWFVSLGNITLPININIGSINNPQITFQDILSMNFTDGPEIRNTFFIHNEKIYAYISHNSNYSNFGDEFFVVDLQGKNKKVISNSDEMRLAQFIHIDNNEAYYYTMYSDRINKINLDTGDITVIFEFEDEFFPLEYELVRQKLYDLKPEFQNSYTGDYIVEDDYYTESYYPRTITVKNIKTNEVTAYEDTIHWNIEDSILYLLRGVRKDTGIYDYSSIKNIHVDKILLE